MEIGELFRTDDRNEWRSWLSANFRSKNEIWFVFPMKSADESRVSYNDAVEEALCFGWIDGIIKQLDPDHRAQRFTPRRKGSPYSRPNIERLIWLEKNGMIHPDIRESVIDIIAAPYVFPKDIIDRISSDEEVWKNYRGFSEPYKRIRIAYIDAARKRPEEFERRLKSFMDKTRKNILVGYGGIEKYY